MMGYIFMFTPYLVDIFDGLISQGLMRLRLATGISPCYNSPIHSSRISTRLIYLY